MAELKQKQKFEQMWNQFKGLTGSQTPEKVVKIESAQVANIFQKVVAERDQRASEAFEIKLIGILESKIELDKAVNKGREELAKKEEVEYEKLNKALSDAFAMLNMARQQNQQLVTQAAGNFTPPAGTEGDGTPNQEPPVEETK